jgi:predicted metal-dependent phosphoesterase TrpH
MSTLPVIKSFCRECYSIPEEVYEKLKRRGMDLVTVTDHDSVGSADSLQRYPDFFLSEEVTCRMPSGTEAHLGVYDIDERQHQEIQARRDDLVRLLAYLKEQQIVFSLNHPFSSLTGRRELLDFDWFSVRFPVLEVLNGHLLPDNNRLASEFAEGNNREAIAGSDAHTVLSVGSAFTEVPGARNKQEFIQGLRRGMGRVYGDPGNFWKLTLDVLWIALQCIKEKPALSLLAPLALLIPAFTLVNSAREARFARRYARYAISQREWRRDACMPPGPLGSPEVVT